MRDDTLSVHVEVAICSIRLSKGVKMEAVVLLSGGLDSTTLLYEALDRHPNDLIQTLSFNYGQRHRKELDIARASAERVSVAWSEIDLRSLGELLTGSALSDESVAVPHGHYAAETMVQTIVPNRNSIMLNCAVGVAISQGATLVYAAMHTGDHFIYPDCRPEFIEALNYCIRVANAQVEGPRMPRVYAPFIEWSKADIVRRGDSYDVPFAETWSCYEGGDIHCGRCGTCVERAEAFYLAHVEDPTEYADTEFWKTETQHAN